MENKTYKEQMQNRFFLKTIFKHLNKFENIGVIAALIVVDREILVEKKQEFSHVP